MNHNPASFSTSSEDIQVFWWLIHTIFQLKSPFAVTVTDDKHDLFDSSCFLVQYIIKIIDCLHVLAIIMVYCLSY